MSQIYQINGLVIDLNGISEPLDIDGQFGAQLASV